MSLREIFSNVVEKSPIEIYLSANDGAVLWLPCRMQPVHEANPSYRSQCKRYIVDSSFNKPEITNEDVLKKGHKMGADSVILEDVYQNYEATIEKLREGKGIAQEHDYSGRIIYPIQAPYIECWERIGQPEHIAIGGLKDASDDERIRACHELRNAGHTGTIHGLGWGISDRLAREIRTNPELIDSVDSRTPNTEALTHDYWTGTDVSRSMELHTAGYLLEDYRKVSVADDPIEERTLSDYL